MTQQHYNRIDFRCIQRAMKTYRVYFCCLFVIVIAFAAVRLAYVTP